MTTEAKKQDYTHSAENLCNPTEVKELIYALHLEQDNKAILEAKLKEQCTELVEGIARSGVAIANIQQQIRETIDTYGSYQDIGTGDYAIKYRRMIRSYHVQPFKDKYDKYVPAVVEEAINVKALDGLIKGGLLKPDELKTVGVITEEAQFAYYIR